MSSPPTSVEQMPDFTEFIETYLSLMLTERVNP